MAKEMTSALIKTSTSFIMFFTTLSYYLYFGFFACNLVSQVLCEISSPSELTGIAGQDVIFNFKTTDKNPIIAAKFGLDNGGEEGPSPKFITVMYKKGKLTKTYGEDLDGPAAASYKNRVLFEGNLNNGHASFRLKNLTVDDTNLYLCKIREDSDGNYKRTKRIKLTVIEKEYKDFKGVANKTCKSYSCIRHGNIKLVVYDALKRAYWNMPIKYKIKMKPIRNVNRKVTAWFHISLAKAVNRSYAYSFLESAQRNNQLNGYNITCFREKVDVKHPPEKGDVKHAPADNIYNPFLIILFVIFGLLGLILLLGIILYKCNPELVQPFIRRWSELRRTLGEFVSNTARRQQAN